MPLKSNDSANLSGPSLFTTNRGRRHLNIYCIIYLVCNCALMSLSMWGKKMKLLLLVVVYITYLSTYIYRCHRSIFGYVVGNTQTWWMVIVSHPIGPVDDEKRLRYNTMQHRLNERLKCWSAMFRSHYTIQFHKLLLYKLFIAVHCKFRPQNTMAMLPCSMAMGVGMRNATSNKMSTYVTYSLSLRLLCISHDNHFTIFSVLKVHTVVHAGRHEECIL